MHNTLEATSYICITYIKRKGNHRGGKLARNIEVLLRLASLPMANRTPKCRTRIDDRRKSNHMSKLPESPEFTQSILYYAYVCVVWVLNIDTATQLSAFKQLLLCTCTALYKN